MTTLTRRELSGRKRGAISVKHTVVSRYAKENYSRKEHQQMLDFGAGKYYEQAQLLACCAYDTPKNSEEYFEFYRPLEDQKFQIVLLSNVLNVQSSIKELEDTVHDVLGFVKTGGEIIANYPQSPRYMGLSKREMKTVLQAWFHVQKTKDGLWILRRK